jgi:hypothetical protein
VLEAMGWCDDGVAVEPPRLRASVHERAAALAGLYAGVVDILPKGRS